EFANELHGHGMPLHEAAVEAARERLRPILMTSFAFILGVLPLMLASGAGAGAHDGANMSARRAGQLFFPFALAVLTSCAQGPSYHATPAVAPDVQLR